MNVGKPYKHRGHEIQLKCEVSEITGVGFWCAVDGDDTGMPVEAHDAEVTCELIRNARAYAEHVVEEMDNESPDAAAEEENP